MRNINAVWNTYLIDCAGKVIQGRTLQSEEFIKECCEESGCTFLAYTAGICEICEGEEKTNGNSSIY